MNKGKNSHLHLLLTTSMHKRLMEESEQAEVPLSQYIRIKLGEEYDLNQIAFENLKKCKKNKYGTIDYKEVWTKLCTHFSICKEECRALLRRFEKEGKIKFVKCCGIKILKRKITIPTERFSKIQSPS